MRGCPGAVRLTGMSDTRTQPGVQTGESPREPARSDEPHPVDAVLAALRAVPDSVLRNLEPATIYLPDPAPRGDSR